MTFIASVVAKDGVAIIADSLVSASEIIMDFEDYKKYVAALAEGTEVNPHDLLPLFQKKTSYNRDYEKKLIKYDKFTAITTTGQAYINDTSIFRVVSEIKSKVQKKGYHPLHFQKNLKAFIEEIDRIARKHIDKTGEIRLTEFLVTHYRPSNYKTTVIKVRINNSTKVESENKKYKVVTTEQPSIRVVCAGQNQIAQRILYGDVWSLQTTLPILTKIARESLARHGIEEKNQLPEGYFKDLFPFDEIIKNQEVLAQAQIASLSELSLQQATDLAALLIKIEIDFQKYTKRIPTVGGRVKLAVIDEGGFRFIRGEKIFDPLSN